jgi:transposase
MSAFKKVIALDRADDKIDVCVWQDQACRFETVSTRPEELHSWWQRETGRQQASIAVVFEQPAENLVAFFSAKSGIAIYALNPMAVNRYRQAFQTSGAKSDGGDCEIMADLIAHHAGRFKPMQSGSEELQRLGELIESRRALISERVNLTNRLRSSL